MILKWIFYLTNNYVLIYSYTQLLINQYSFNITFISYTISLLFFLITAYSFILSNDLSNMTTAIPLIIPLIIPLKKLKEIEYAAKEIIIQSYPTIEVDLIYENIYRSVLSETENSKEIKKQTYEIIVNELEKYKTELKRIESYPREISNVLYEAMETRMERYSLFRGTPNQQLLFLIYLTTKYDNVSAYIPRTIEVGQLKLPDFKISWECTNIIKKGKKELNNIKSRKSKRVDENKLKVPKEIIKTLVNYQERFFIIPLSLSYAALSTNTEHANVLVYDKVKNTMERFEPYGGAIKLTKSYKDYKMEKLDNKLRRLFSSVLGSDLIYLSASDICPFISFQAMEYNCYSCCTEDCYSCCTEDKLIEPLEHDNKNIFRESVLNHSDQGMRTNASKCKLGNPEGFCAAWSLYYIDVRLSNIDIPPDILLSHLLDSIRGSDVLDGEFNLKSGMDIEEKKGKRKCEEENKFTRFIRNYSNYVMKMGMKIIEPFKLSNSMNNILESTMLSSLINHPSFISPLNIFSSSSPSSAFIN